MLFVVVEYTKVRVKKNNFSERVMNKQKILILATTASMIEQFNMHNINILQSLGAEVHVGTNFNSPGTITKQISAKLVSTLEKMGISCHQVDFMRGIGTPRSNKKALNQVCKIIKDDGITGIHAHSPLGGIIGRRAAHKMGVKIIYTAHGLQFFKGGPLRDWLLFFPIEWFYAHWTDALVTINTDDYNISKMLPVKDRYYIPGVGIDLKSVKQITAENREYLRMKTRKKLGIKDDDFLIISVGELSKRKNHATIVRAIKKINDPHIKYVIAGIGKERENLLHLIKKFNLEKNIFLLGYIEDLDGLYFAGDLNAFVSRREGLGIGGLDGVAHGLYILGNGNTGMKDYISVPRSGLLVKHPNCVNEIADDILTIKNRKLKITDNPSIERFDHSNIDILMKKIYIKEFFGK